MDTIDTSAPVLVTGGTGYIASWIVKYLLEDGRQVRATVRNKADQEKNGHLTTMGESSKGTLELHEADLLAEGSFDEAMKDCQIVIHTASPFFISGIKNPQRQLIDPALKGTRNVLNSVNKASTVKRVVLTSSVAALYGDAMDINQTSKGVLTEDDWNTTSNLSHQPYAYSKTLAEKEAWKIVESQERWDLNTINPGFVLGPSLTDRVDSTSIDFMISVMNGTYKMGAPDLFMPFVDVRDVAKAHILAGDIPSASGRHILAADTFHVLEMAKMLSEAYPDHKIPQKILPNFLLYLVGPFQGMSWSYLRKNLGFKLGFDNSYSQKDLNLEYRPLKETFHDQAKQLIESGLVKG